MAETINNWLSKKNSYKKIIELGNNLFILNLVWSDKKKIWGENKIC